MSETMPHIIPRATMRLQLHKDFTFAQAADLIPYLVDLNISHVYSSPILAARAGSMHGYDVVDPTHVNPELGGETEFRKLVSALRAAGLGLIVDIVPNHMAVGASDNPWWTDLLQHGRNSRYADFFDVNWACDDPSLRGKVLAPFLGKPYGEALESGEIKLVKSNAGQPVIRYFDTDFPIAPSDYAHITESEFESFDPGNPDGRAMLHTLLERQNYRLAWWATAGDEINWRRFFDINGLAGLRIELPEVFEAAHTTLFRLYAEGLIDGFRVDHVDGLSDPPDYCRRLRKRLNELAVERPDNAPNGRAYLVVEKILGVGEKLPSDWQVDGTSGYDFMDEVSLVQHDNGHEDALSTLWHATTGRSAAFKPEELVAREEILLRNFDSSLRSLTDALHRIARADLRTRDVSAAAIRRALISMMCHFPVYRGYNTGSERAGADQAVFSQAVADAKENSPRSEHNVLDHIDRWLGGEPADGDTLPLRQRAATLFYQLSAPLAAKAVEDTAFYRYGRLLSRNDVGFDAARLGSPIAAFHEACENRRATFPNAMLATATHDHKRGEDVRARLAVISEIPEDWASFVAAARSLPASARPDATDEIMLYQTIIGAWPLLLDPTNEAERKDFADRVAAWQQKALREAKLRTSWTFPDEAYEQTAQRFLADCLSDGSAFWALGRSFVDRIAAAGAVNGLAQTALKMTVPGMPDFFQGTDFWDFSLVDPDNRRPVDYAGRRTALAGTTSPSVLLQNWRDGRVKQAMMRRILELRRRKPQLFSHGDYVPLEVKGTLADRIIAFARLHDDDALITIVPRRVHELLKSGPSLELQPEKLRNHLVILPHQLAERDLRSAFGSGATFKPSGELPLDMILSDFPIAALVSVESS